MSAAMTSNQVNDKQTISEGTTAGVGWGGVNAGGFQLFTDVGAGLYSRKMGAYASLSFPDTYHYAI